MAVGVSKMQALQNFILLLFTLFSHHVAASSLTSVTHHRDVKPRDVMMSSSAVIVTFDPVDRLVLERKGPAKNLKLFVNASHDATLILRVSDTRAVRFDRASQLTYFQPSGRAPGGGWKVGKEVERREARQIRKEDDSFSDFLVKSSDQQLIEYCSDLTCVQLKVTGGSTEHNISLLGLYLARTFLLVHAFNDSDLTGNETDSFITRHPVNVLSELSDRTKLCAILVLAGMSVNLMGFGCTIDRQGLIDIKDNPRVLIIAFCLQSIVVPGASVSRS